MYLCQLPTEVSFVSVTYHCPCAPRCACGELTEILCHTEVTSSIELTAKSAPSLCQNMNRKTATYSPTYTSSSNGELRSDKLKRQMHRFLSRYIRVVAICVCAKLSQTSA